MVAPSLTADVPLSPRVAPLAPPIPPTAAIAAASSASPSSARRRRTTSLVPGARIGMWRIESELGRGGMATVYAVVHTRFGKRAALKLAHAGILGPQFTAQTFLREARIANLVNHAGVAEVFATGSYGGRPWLAMERLHGRSLAAVLDDGPLPRDTALDILLELCDVLAAAHASGVTHGDLKVENVFVLDHRPDRPGDRRIKLLDWGIARIAGEDDPLRGLIAGTLTYVAPEQILGCDIAPAADVYALGVLAYRLLLGEPPFVAAKDLELLHKHLRDDPPRPRMRWPQIPAKLEATLLAMLAKQPGDRPSLSAVAEALHAARRRIRPSRRPRPQVDRSQIAPLPPDVIGRPVIGELVPRRVQRLAGAALGVAMVIASLVRLFSA